MEGEEYMNRKQQEAGRQEVSILMTIIITITILIIIIYRHHSDNKAVPLHQSLVRLTAHSLGDSMEAKKRTRQVLSKVQNTTTVRYAFPTVCSEIWSRNRDPSVCMDIIRRGIRGRG